MNWVQAFDDVIKGVYGRRVQPMFGMNPGPSTFPKRDSKTSKSIPYPLPVAASSTINQMFHPDVMCLGTSGLANEFHVEASRCHETPLGVFWDLWLASCQLGLQEARARGGDCSELGNCFGRKKSSKQHHLVDLSGVSLSAERSSILEKESDVAITGFWTSRKAAFEHPCQWQFSSILDRFVKTKTD